MAASALPDRKREIFVRHNLSSARGILEALWKSRLVAVHFRDDASTNPSDYDRAGKQALSLLWECCRVGAVVGADFRRIRPDSMLVGEIVAGSRVEARVFGAYVYKVVPLAGAREVCFRDYPLLAAIQPQRVTASNWPSAAAHLHAIMRGEGLPPCVESLHPCQVEVLCHEYLRAKGILGALLMPIGRTLRDVDILGIGGDGEQVAAQVTLAASRQLIGHKMNQLLAFGGRNYALFFFGPQAQRCDTPGVVYVAVEDVFAFLAHSGKPVYRQMVEAMLGCKQS